MFVAFLVCCTIGFCFFETRNVDQAESKNVPIIARLVEEKSANFGNTEYILQTDNEKMIATKTDKLELGQKYEISINTTQMSIFDRNDLYNLSKGIQKNISKYTITQNLGCDLECRGIQYLAQTRKYIDRQFQEMSCHSHFWIGKFLAPSVACSDIGTLSKGLVIGGVSFTENMKKNIRNAGITHIVAVSGFQVTLLALFIELLVSKLTIHRTKKIGITIAVLLGFTLLVGFEPPILRALIMAIMIYTIQLMGRRVPMINVILYSAMLLLIINPFLIYSASFQLSYLASFALSTLPNMSRFYKMLHPIISQVAEVCIASMWIFLWTTPVIAQLSGSFSPITILVNTLIIPFIPIITVFNIFALIPVVGELFYLPSILFESLLLQSISNIQIPSILIQFSSLETVNWYGSMVLLSMAIKWKNLIVTR
jgi:ComEC/Rec2-related protein